MELLPGNDATILEEESAVSESWCGSNEINGECVSLQENNFVFGGQVVENWNVSGEGDEGFDVGVDFVDKVLESFRVGLLKKKDFCLL